MTIEEIRKGAPSGANGYMVVKYNHVLDLTVYFKEANNKLWIYSTSVNEWLEDSRTRRSEIKPLF